MPALGFDFFSGNGKVWEQVDAHPPAFVIIGGVTGVTSYFDRYGGRSLSNDFQQAARRHIPRSAYGLYVEGIDPILQAKALVSLVSKAGGADFPLALDLEVWSGTPNPIASNVLLWLQTVEALSGWRPLVYTSQGMWDSIVGPTPWASSYDLWIANYPDNAPVAWHEPPGDFIPLLPSPWLKAGKSWLIWQYGGGNLDFNVFKGDASDFSDYVSKFKRRNNLTILDTIKTDADILALPDATDTFIEVTVASIDTGISTRVKKEYRTTLGDVRSWGTGVPQNVDTLYAVGTPWTNVRAKAQASSSKVGQLEPSAQIKVTGSILDPAGPYHFGQITEGLYAGDFVAREFLSVTRPL